MADKLVKDYQLSVSKACQATGLSRAAWYRRPTAVSAGDEAVMVALNSVMERWSRWGFWKCFDWLRGQGHAWNHKRVWRVYCAMKLNLPRRTKRMRLTRERQELSVYPMANHSWSLDFMSDALYSGKRFRTLNILDEGVRECLGIEIDTSLPAERVVRVLDRIASWRGVPAQLRMDNGPEFISSTLAQWCQQHHVQMLHIQPGKPNQNAYIERFNRTFRHEVLDAYLFDSLQEARDVASEWMIDYNEERPHDALHGMAPTVYREKISAGNSTLELST